MVAPVVEHGLILWFVGIEHLCDVRIAQTYPVFELGGMCMFSEKRRASLLKADTERPNQDLDVPAGRPHMGSRLILPSSANPL